MSTRRYNGEGTICKRADGRYMGKIMNGYKPDGKKNIVCIYGKTHQEVRDKLKELSLEIELKSKLEPKTTEMSPSTTLAVWLERWMDRYNKGFIKPKTFEVYQINIKNNINAKLGNVKLKDLKASDVQAHFQELATRLAPETLRKVRSILKTALYQAIEDDLIIKNPAKKIKLAEYEKKKIKFFDKKEILKLELIIETSIYRPLFELLIDSGLRIGEALGLLWTSVDLDNKIITIQNGVVRLKEQGVIVQDTLKTIASKRTIRITDRVASSLKKMQMISGDKKLVFCTRNNTPLDPKNIRRHFQGLLKKADIDKCGLHAIRHTFATELFAEGIDGIYVQKLLGHSRESTTKDIYIHTTEAGDDNVMDALERINKKRSLKLASV